MVPANSQVSDRVQGPGHRGVGSAVSFGSRAARSARRRLRWRVLSSPRVRTALTREFHFLYHMQATWGGTWLDTTYFGVPVLKNPLDMWIYQELLYSLRPDLIIETGTYLGGSALYLAHLCDLLGGGKVVTIDTEARPNRPEHPRIEYLTGSSTSEEVLTRVGQLAQGAAVTMVILDSDHARDNVLNELRCYSPLVTPGSYLIVEDTNIMHPVLPTFGPGPMEAVDEFLADSKDFEIDEKCEKFLFTFNPGGFLRRRKTSEPS